MGGCASKNKQKEEPYKPANAPGSPPVDFEEIVPETKAPVASKPLMKLNGSVAEGDKRAFHRNSLVGPGGVILASQPEVKDETDPTIPFIDASEDELDDDTPSRSRRSLRPTVEAAVESVTVAGVEAAAPHVTDAVAGVKARAEDASQKAAAKASQAAAAVEVVVTDVSTSVSEAAGDAAKSVEVVVTDVSTSLNQAAGDVFKSAEVVETDVSTSVNHAAGDAAKGVEVVETDVSTFANQVAGDASKSVEDVETDVSTSLNQAAGDVSKFVNQAPSDAAKSVDEVEEDVFKAVDVDVVEASKVAEVEADVIQASTATEVSAALGADQVIFPTQEVGDLKEEVAAEADALNDDFKIEANGESLVDQVMRSVSGGDSYPIEVEAVADSQPEAIDTEKSAVTSGDQWLEEVVNGGLQNGVTAAEDMAEHAKEAADPILNDIPDINFGEIQSGLDILKTIDESPEFTGFRLAKEEETDCEVNQERMAETKRSVGALYSPHVMGVGFRVGDKYIMTAYNVIREMLDKIAAQGINTPEMHILGNREIWIQFEFLTMGEYEIDNPTRFKFRSIPYTNPQMDVAIIELELEDQKTLPPPLVNFCGMGKRHKLEFVGYSNDPEKRKSMVRFALQPTAGEVQKAGEWCQRHGYPPRGYDGLKDLTKLRFQCADHFGSSGTPGVVATENSVYVVAMQTKGYPSFYLHVEKHLQNDIPDTFKLVEATSMTDVYVDMRDRCPALCENVYGLTVSKQES